MSHTDSIIEFLKDIGLKEREVKTYLVVLKTGSVSAGERASYLQLPGPPWVRGGELPLQSLCLATARRPYRDLDFV